MPEKSRKYSSVDEILEVLAPWEKVIFARLRHLVTENLPKAKEKILFGAPFYTGNRMICFIWPPSLANGPKQKEKGTQKGVSLGFCQGNLLADTEGILLAEGRKQVYCLYFRHLNDIQDDIIRTYLNEAGMVDEEFGKKKARRR